VKAILNNNNSNDKKVPMLSIILSCTFKMFGAFEHLPY
jgi:hypothetical protein